MKGRPGQGIKIGVSVLSLAAAATALAFVSACGGAQPAADASGAKDCAKDCAKDGAKDTAKPALTPDGSGPPPDHSVHAEHAADHVGAHHGDKGEYKVANARHRFNDAQRWAKVFETDKRDQWQRGDEVVKALQLPASAAVADIGSATGYFAVRFARSVGAGKVFGVDIEPDMVRYLAMRARKEGLANVRSVLGQADDPLLPEPVDLIFVCNTYHHISGRVAYFRRLAKALRKGGRVAIVDFKMGDIPVGPPPSHRIPPEVISRELTAAGYKLQRRDDMLLPYQHLLIFSR